MNLGPDEGVEVSVGIAAGSVIEGGTSDGCSYGCWPEGTVMVSGENILLEVDSGGEIGVGTGAPDTGCCGVEALHASTSACNGDGRSKCSTGSQFGLVGDNCCSPSSTCLSAIDSVSVDIASSSAVELQGVGWCTFCRDGWVEGICGESDSCGWKGDVENESGVGAVEGEEESDGSGGLSHEEGRLVN